jgi:amidophosphoribosyltransferase
MCGIIGLAFVKKDSMVAQALVDGLTILQHRGQDASGIATSFEGRMNLVKDSARVSDVFTQDNIVNAVGNIGIGHVRYPTAGTGKRCEAQPMYTNYPYGIAIGHNGNLTNTDELIASLKHSNRHINTDSDSELLLNVFAEELSARQKLPRSSNVCSCDDIFEAAEALLSKCKGAYAAVLLINGVGLLAVRDPHGIRPLCFGSRETPEGDCVKMTFFLHAFHALTTAATPLSRNRLRHRL